MKHCVPCCVTWGAPWDLLLPYPMGANEHLPAGYVSSTSCIGCDLSQCHLSVTTDNSGQTTLTRIIKNPWSTTVLSMVGGNTFHQVFLALDVVVQEMSNIFTHVTFV